jgi:hypothetical protein
MKLVKSVSPETLKMITEECSIFLNRVNYYKDFTEISNDSYIFHRLAIIATLLENICDNTYV